MPTVIGNDRIMSVQGMWIGARHDFVVMVGCTGSFFERVRVVLAEISERTMMSMFGQHQGRVLGVRKGYFHSTDMFWIFLACEGVVSAGFCDFLSSLAVFATTCERGNLHWALPVLTVDDRRR